jgi:hypothetical protein
MIPGAMEAMDLPSFKTGGEGGIRTLGTLLGYGALAKRCFRPLSHLTKSSGDNIANNCRLPISNCQLNDQT